MSFLKRLWGDAGLPNWSAWISKEEARWEEAKRRSNEGPSVLIATGVAGFAAGAVIESMLAVALTLRGAKVQILLCDEALPACQEAHTDRVSDLRILQDYRISELLCKNCVRQGDKLFAPLGLRVRRYSEFLSQEEKSSARVIAHSIQAGDIASYRFDGIAAGEHAMAGTCRFFACGTLDLTDDQVMVLRRYLEAAILSAIAVRNLARSESFDVACLNHGIYVPQGLTAAALRQENVRIVAWNVAYRKHCFIFSHDDTYHHTLRDEPTSAWDSIPWSMQLETQTTEYIASRAFGTRDWIWFHEKPLVDIDNIAKACGVDFSRPCIGLLTNVFWDAQLHYPANVFRNMRDWIVETIRYFERRSDLQLLIRIHPAEIRGTIRSRQPMLAEIEKAFPKLPPNVFVIPPESNSSTYAAMLKCNAAIIYGTKTGVELASMGLPVIAAGEAWIRGKQISADPTTRDEYFKILDQLPICEQASQAKLERARKYAFHFFFRRMIPLSFIEPVSSNAFFKINIKGLDNLLPNCFSGLDVICDGILNGTPFVYPAESEQNVTAA